LTLGIAVGRSLAVGGMVGKLSIFARPWPDRRLFGPTARRYVKFPLLTTWSRTLNSAGLQLPIVILSAMYGAAAIGFLALTMRVLASPVNIVADAVGQYFEGSFAATLRARDGSIGRAA